MRFIGKKIKVDRKGVSLTPVSFVMDGREYVIANILRQWQDYGFNPADPRRDWTTRRHRNYYRVEAEDGKVFEIYLDRSNISKPVWYVTGQIEE